MQRSFAPTAFLPHSFIQTLLCPLLISFFRSFPSKAIQAKRTKLDDLQKSLTTAKDTEKETRKKLDDALKARQQTKERKVKLDRLHTLRSKKRALDDESKLYEVCDPERLKKLKAGVVVCKDSANRWTENCQLMVSYFKKKGIEVDAAVSQTHTHTNTQHRKTRHNTTQHGTTQHNTTQSTEKHVTPVPAAVHSRQRVDVMWVLCE